MSKQTIYQLVAVKHNNTFGYSYFSGDMFRSFRPSSDHLTET